VAAPTLRIALVQQDTVWHDVGENLARARSYAHLAARDGARVVAFPELMTTGFTMEPEPHAQSIPGPTADALGAIALAFGVWIIGTLIESHTPRPRNAAVAFRPDGAIAAVYRKIHPFSYGDESAHYVGGTECPVFDLDGVRTGLQICYDLRFPETFRSLSGRGAELVFVPANWPTRRSQHWSTLLAARAIENQMVVCGINRVGHDPSLAYPGLSAIYGARGEALAAGTGLDGVVMADVDFAEVAAWRAQFPALRDRRPDVYATLA